MHKRPDKHLLSKEDKKSYTSDRIVSGLRQIRLTFFVSAILYGLFAFLDNQLIDTFLPAFLIIRFAIVIPLLIVFLASTYHPAFVKMAQPLIVLCFVAAGAGIAFMLIMARFIRVRCLSPHSFWGQTSLVLLETDNWNGLDAPISFRRGRLSSKMRCCRNVSGNSAPN